MNEHTYSDDLREVLLRHTANIRGWAEARNLIAGATPQSQFLKLTEEAGELADGARMTGLTTYHDDVAKSMDGLGDTIVVATIINAQLGFSNEELVTLIYERYMQEANTGGQLLIALSKLAGALARGKREAYLSATSSVVVEALYTYVEAFGDEAMNGTTMSEIVADDCMAIVDSDAELLDRCLTLVWNEIKDRKGVMFHGVFIKADDERYTGALAELGLSA